VSKWEVTPWGSVRVTEEGIKAMLDAQKILHDKTVPFLDRKMRIDGKTLTKKKANTSLARVWL
jgi:hypothetical protein